LLCIIEIFVLLNSMKITRNIVQDIASQKDKYPILAITGPRQSGKTTVMKQVFPDYTYISLENPDTRLFAEKDPRQFLKQYNSKVIFDEVQRVPKLFSYLQEIVDSSDEMGRFILSGSQNFLLIHNITQSLAGRVALFQLFPFDLQELKASKWIKEDISTQITTGFYPAIYDRDIDPARYYADYINTYIKRDITELVNIHDMELFMKFVKLCAARTGQLLNYNNLAKDASISNNTAKSWLNLLEASYVCFTLNPYYKNFSKRLIKSPKLYFYDTGLVCQLLKIKAKNLMPTHLLYGQLFENLVISEKIKLNNHKSRNEDFYFWRDSHGKEIDLLKEEDGKLTCYEIKSSETIHPRMFKGLDYMGKLAGEENIVKVLIYGGDVSQQRTNYTITSWLDLK